MCVLMLLSMMPAGVSAATVTSSETINMRTDVAYKNLSANIDRSAYDYGWDTMEISFGSLPPGLTWSWGEVSNPNFSGTPTKAGTYTATFHGKIYQGDYIDHTVTFIVRDPSAANPFTDVEEGAFYYDAVMWAVNHDPQITNGMAADVFGSNNHCTRGQIVTFLYRAMP